jgi:hypothetical protein
MPTNSTPIEDTSSYRQDESRDIRESKTPTILIAGHQVDRDAVILGVSTLIVWGTICWYIMNNIQLPPMFKWPVTIIMSLFAVYIVVAVLSMDPSSGGIVFELNNLTSVEQMISVILGSFVVFFGLIFFIPSIPTETRHVLITLACVSLLLLGVISMWVNTIMSGRAFRNLRRFKQAMYNMVLCLFIIQNWILLSSSMLMIKN